MSVEPSVVSVDQLIIDGVLTGNGPKHTQLWSLMNSIPKALWLDHMFLLGLVEEKPNFLYHLEVSPVTLEQMRLMVFLHSGCSGLADWMSLIVIPMYYLLNFFFQFFADSKHLLKAFSLFLTWNKGPLSILFAYSTMSTNCIFFSCIRLEAVLLMLTIRLKVKCMYGCR